MTHDRRRGVFVFGEPKAPDAELGTCRWCGAELTGKNAHRRNYCYLDREGRNCVHEWNTSHMWDTRKVVRRMNREAGRRELRCVDCGFVCEEIVDGHWRKLRYWEADHELALADAGEHVKENLRCRCGDCHRDKTAREASARATRRKASGRPITVS